MGHTTQLKKADGEKFFPVIYDGGNGDIAYEGERIVLQKPSFSSRLLYTLLGRTTIQSMAEYNGTLLVIQTSGTVITGYFYDESSGALLGSCTFPYSTARMPHSNMASFSKAFPNGNTSFPYLYLSHWDGARGCSVYSITRNGDTFTATEVQIITPPGVSSSNLGAGNVDWAIDTDNQMLYSFGYKDNAIIGAKNYTKICQFALPDPTSGAVTLSDSDIICSFQVEAAVARQQATYYNGRFYMVNGIPGSADYDEAVLRVIDIAAKGIVSRIDLTKVLNAEPEGLVVKNGYMLLTFYGTGGCYELTF